MGLDRREEVVCWYVSWEQAQVEFKFTALTLVKCAAIGIMYLTCGMACPLRDWGGHPNLA